MALIWLVASVICLSTALVASSVQETHPAGLSAETPVRVNAEASPPTEPGLVTDYPAVANESLPV